MLQLHMQHEITTSEAVEIFSVTRKTIAEWAKHGIMEKTSYGKYNLKNCLRNWVIYQRVIREGYNDPLLVWSLRMDEIWKGRATGAGR
jgi:phage terminase Nu1 subunit (DNA packaging protein)